MIRIHSPTHRCKGHYFPRKATPVSQHETTRPTVGDEKLHINSPQLDKTSFIIIVQY